MQFSIGKKLRRPKSSVGFRQVKDGQRSVAALPRLGSCLGSAKLWIGAARRCVPVDPLRSVLLMPKPRRVQGSVPLPYRNFFPWYDKNARPTLLRKFKRRGSIFDDVHVPGPAHQMRPSLRTHASEKQNPKTQAETLGPSALKLKLCRSCCRSSPQSTSTAGQTVACVA